ncbi:MAG: diadenylate cyclase CdaA [Spirochaetia bacterium]|nr:diadenylate cyclase CdaA [Spirochaetota bacterium]MCX8097335.1 diadenylate cyclase CdaA [Spirochaetota bacterium]MDW8112816.1 diadenylate cyclase CdaA [Spirochaetia bacterium]
MEFISFVRPYIIGAIEISIIWFVIYKTFDFLKKTKAGTIINGILIFVLIGIVSRLLNFEVLNWFFDSVVTYSILILILIFREEIRDILLHIGSLRILSRAESKPKPYAHELKEILEAIDTMSKERIGAILVFERRVPLGDYINTGVTMNATISKDRLLSIFNKSSSFHDGATIVRGLKIVAAACILPIGPLPPGLPSDKVFKKLGTRHRAGYGISRETDAIALIISEETGKISIAMDFYFNYDVDLEVVEDVLKNYFENFAR